MCGFCPSIHVNLLNPLTERGVIKRIDVLSTQHVRTDTNLRGDCSPCDRVVASDDFHVDTGALCLRDRRCNLCTRRIKEPL